MPAAYAHHTFGQACIDLMPEKVKAVCLRHREVFDFGVHGPDLLFYYKPLSSNEVNRHGSELHHWTGKQFFEICRYVYLGMPFGQLQDEPEESLPMTSSEKNALLAYILGFLAHFTLDSSCHPYINQMTEESSLSHNLIESQYEAYLMRKDGKKPLEIDRSLTLIPSKKRAQVVSHVFPFDEETILECMKGQKMTLHLFYSPGEYKKKLVREAIGLLKIRGDFADLFLDEETITECEVFNEEILARQQKAIERYPILMKNLLNYLYDKEELTEYFQHDFEGEFHE